MNQVPFSSVIISNEKIQEIKAAISQVENANLIFNTWGFNEVFEKGTAVSLLFYGIPGTGKTLMAQAIADFMGSNLKVIGTAEIESSEPGGAERAIKQVFKEANEQNNKYKTSPSSYRPITILFDECDSLLSDRNEVGVILAAQVNTLLSELEHYDGVIIFTTNRLGKLDPALERRITAKIEFEFPNRTQRVAIWRRMIPKNAPLAPEVDFEKLSEFPMVGGNIKNAVLNAARMAAYKKLSEITLDCFIEAIERELKSIQAFVSEYEEQLHNSRTPLAKHLVRDSFGVRVGKETKRKIEVKENKNRKEQE